MLDHEVDGINWLCLLRRPLRVAMEIPMKSIRLTLLCWVLIQALLLPPVFQTQPSQAAPRPNIIVIMTDDLDADPATLATMPNLRMFLAQQGMSFANAIVSMPSCCPSRASFFTGRYVHNHGVGGNTYPYGGFRKFFEMGQEQQTFAVTMQGAGYRTALMGKYLNGYPLPAAPLHIPPGWTEWFVYSNGGLFYRYNLNENGKSVRYLGAEADYSTDVLSRKAVDFIHRHRQNSPQAPFFLVITPFAPHTPAKAAPRHAHLFQGVQAPRTAAFNEVDVRDKPAWVKKLAPLTKTQIRQIDRLYQERLRTLQAVDEMIGQLVQTLVDTNQLANTYIVLTSDNGFHFGEHRIVTGKGTAYDEAIRVPLLVRGPGISAGIVQTQIVSLIDLAPTFAEIAGQPAITMNFDGRSLLPLWHSQRAEPSWRAAILFENPPHSGSEGVRSADAEDGELLDPDEQADFDYIEGIEADQGEGEPDENTVEAAALKPEKVGGTAYNGLRTATYKYVEYKNGFREYYDLLQDPAELNNLALTMNATMLNELSAWLAALKSCAGDSCRSADLLPESVRAAQLEVDASNQTRADSTYIYLPIVIND